jgi:hypothetical protein
MAINNGIRIDIWTVQNTRPLAKPSPEAPAGSIHAKTTISASELNRKYFLTDTAVESNQRDPIRVASVIT